MDVQSVKHHRNGVRETLLRGGLAVLNRTQDGHDVLGGDHERLQDSPEAVQQRQKHAGVVRVAWQGRHCCQHVLVCAEGVLCEALEPLQYQVKHAALVHMVWWGMRRKQHMVVTWDVQSHRVRT